MNFHQQWFLATVVILEDYDAAKMFLFPSNVVAALYCQWSLCIAQDQIVITRDYLTKL